MPDAIDAVARGARVTRLGPDFRWPGGRKVAVVMNIAFEIWSDGKAPGIGPMGNPLPAGTFDTNALSWGHFGPARGIERLLRALDKAKLKSSVMVNGIVAQKAPGMLKAIANAGHEIVAHAYAQDIIPARLTAEEAKADIDRTTSELKAAAGVTPRGWISPRGTPHPDSARLLVEAGYVWQGDVFDDDRPYVQHFDDGKRIVAIPLTMEVNDLPHAMRFGRSPRQFVELFDDALSHMVQDDDATMMDVTAHGHCYGRAPNVWAYAEIAAKAAKRDDIWVATRGEIAQHVRSVAG